MELIFLNEKNLDAITNTDMVVETPEKVEKKVTSGGPPTYYDIEKKKKKKELSFEDKLQKFLHESKQIQFALKKRTEVKLCGGKKKYAKRHKKTK